MTLTLLFWKLSQENQTDFEWIFQGRSQKRYWKIGEPSVFILEICGLCIRYGINDDHVGPDPKRTAAESDWRGDGDDHGHLPQCGAGQGETTGNLFRDFKSSSECLKIYSGFSCCPQKYETLCLRAPVFLCRRTAWTSRSRTARPRPPPTCAAWRPTSTSSGWTRPAATASAKLRRATRSRPSSSGPKTLVRIQRWGSHL